jgi:hypothetical protein
VTWQSGRRRDDLATTIEAAIVRAIHQHQAAGKSGFLALSILLDEVNRDQPEKWQRTAKWMANKVRGMGWKIQRIGHDKQSVLTWDQELLDRLVVRYGIQDENKQPPPTLAENVPHVPQVPHPPGEPAAHCGTSATCEAQRIADVPHVEPAAASGEPSSAARAAHAAHVLEGVGTQNELLEGEL